MDPSLLTKMRAEECMQQLLDGTRSIGDRAPEIEPSSLPEWKNLYINLVCMFFAQQKGITEIDKVYFLGPLAYR